MNTWVKRGAATVLMGLIAGCGGGGPEGPKVYGGKITGKLTGSKVAQYTQGMSIMAIATSGEHTTYPGEMGENGTFTMTAPPGDYTLVIGTLQQKITVVKGDNTIAVNTDQEVQIPPDQLPAQ